MSQQSCPNSALKNRLFRNFFGNERPHGVIAQILKSTCLAILLYTASGALALAQEAELGEDLKLSKSISQASVKTLAASKSIAESKQSATSKSIAESKQSAASKPLSGQVSVTDSKEKTTSTRLKRSAAPLLPVGEPPVLKPVENKGDSAMSTLFPLKEAGGVKEDTILKEDTNLKEDSKLKGAVSQDELKARQAPYRWNISVYGGYYDASGQIPGVVRGDKLYLYGGTMSDGLTPAPRGPVAVNAQGHFKWQPVGGN